MNKIPISVLIVTKNEEGNIARCLHAVQDFAEIIVIDSHSSDNTCEIARITGAKIISYQWNGGYPKKRQWCLDNLDIRHDWVFWVDGDEVVTPELVAEIRSLFTEKPIEAGFFIRGRYMWNGYALKHGLQNNKLALIDRAKLAFPVIDDLSINGMDEIEGHYQPVKKSGFKGANIGQLGANMLHYAYDNRTRWLSRHARYANWEAGMIKHCAWPVDPIIWREMIKKRIRSSIFRPYIVFLYSYIFKLGILDGVNGYHFALSRKKYCDLILKKLKNGA